MVSNFIAFTQGTPTPAFTIAHFKSALHSHLANHDASVSQKLSLDINNQPQQIKTNTMSAPPPPPPQGPQTSNAWRYGNPVGGNYQLPAQLAAWAQANQPTTWQLALTPTGVRRYSIQQRYELEELYQDSMKYPTWGECAEIAAAMGRGGRDGLVLTTTNIDVSAQMYKDLEK